MKRRAMKKRSQKWRRWPRVSGPGSTSMRRSRGLGSTVDRRSPDGGGGTDGGEDELMLAGSRSRGRPNRAKGSSADEILCVLRASQTDRADSALEWAGAGAVA